MIYTLESGSNRMEKKQSENFFGNAMKKARLENKAMAKAMAEPGKQAASSHKDYTGPVELLFIPS